MWTKGFIVFITGLFVWKFYDWEQPVSLVNEAVVIGCSSNFRETLEAVIQGYEGKNGLKVVSASTGKLIYQAKEGAPYDLIFCADDQYLSAIEYHRKKIYAKGQLVRCRWNELNPTDKKYRVAIANPNIAPYGKLAQKYLTKNEGKGKIVYGGNVMVAYQYFLSKEVEECLITQSLVRDRKAGYAVLALKEFTLNQEVGLLSVSKKARHFYDYLDQKEPKSVIANYGYELP